MNTCDLVVIGASAGGIEALLELCRQLPPDLPAAVFVVVHIAPTAPGLLPGILQRRTKVKAVFPQDGDPVERGKFYIAPPNRHLLLESTTIRVTSGPRENGLRPSVDTLFRSAAHSYGPRVVGVVLSGTRSDGSAGLLEIKKYGGTTIVQDPDEALFPGMPVSAIRTLKVDSVLSVDDIANEIARLAHTPVKEKETKHTMNDNQRNKYSQLKDDRRNFEQSDDKQTPRTLLTCPDCGGVLWEVNENNFNRYVCQVGHSFSEESMHEEQGKALEAALWVAVRTLEERSGLLRRMASRAEKKNMAMAHERFNRQADSMEKNAEFIRQVLVDGKMQDSGEELLEDDAVGD